MSSRKRKQQPFGSILPELRKRHSEGSVTQGFAMLGWCLIALEKDKLRFYTESETLQIYRLIKDRCEYVEQKIKEEADVSGGES